MWIAFVCVYIYFARQDKEPAVKEYVIIEECIDSVNAMYGEDIIDRNAFSNGESYAKSEDVLKIIDKLGFDEGFGTGIGLKIGKSKKISREKWQDVLVMISSANGMGDICKEKEINAYYIDEDAKEVISDNGRYSYGMTTKNLMDKRIAAFVRDNNIIFVKDINDEAGFENVLIKSNEDDKVVLSLNGIERSIQVKGLKETLSGIMCDIKIKGGKVKELNLKRDSISGKVQAINETQIEVEGFGNIELSEKFRIFCTYDAYSEKNIDSIQVGEEHLRFIVADKKVCGIFIDETPSADNIRVLIKTSGYKDILHDSVTVSSKSPFYVVYYEQNEKGDLSEKRDLYNAGDSLTFNNDNGILKRGRIRIVAQDENGKIMINSVSRNGSNPEYRGNIELALNEGRIVVINELSLEQYLYAVVPSEMPSSYGVEALKVQAVCARSYAVSHMNNGKLSSYGAQVDDSTDYQVYNSTPENENSISAVKATYGQVLKCGDEIANTYFFATSCGTTTDSTVWGGAELPYIKGRILCKEEDNTDLSDNDNFNKFIKADYSTFDSGNPWYRWNISMTEKELSDSINGNIERIYSMYPDYVLTNTSEGYVSEKISTVGNVTDMYVEKRGVGGTIEELVIKGTKADVKIIKQSAIRNLINPNGVAINKNDGNSVDSFNALPSAFFTVEKNGGSFIIYGGGYGHGAGMSQTAVKGMIEAGMNYEEILKFFYTDVETNFVYE